MNGFGRSGYNLETSEYNPELDEKYKWYTQKWKKLIKEDCSNSPWDKQMRKTITLKEIRIKTQDIFKGEEGSRETYETKDEREKCGKSCEALNKSLAPLDENRLVCGKQKYKKCNLSKALRFKGTVHSQFPGPGAYNPKTPNTKYYMDFCRSLGRDLHLDNTFDSGLAPNMYHKEWKESIPGGSFSREQIRQQRLYSVTKNVAFKSMPSDIEKSALGKKGIFCKTPRFPVRKGLQVPGPGHYEPYKKCLCTKAEVKAKSACSNKMKIGQYKIGVSKQNIAAPGRYQLNPIPLASIKDCRAAFKAPKFTNVNVKESSTKCMPNCVLYDTHDVIKQL